jgi:hypothetical protein
MQHETYREHFGLHLSSSHHVTPIGYHFFSEHAAPKSRPTLQQEIVDTRPYRREVLISVRSMEANGGRGNLPKDYGASQAMDMSCGFAFQLPVSPIILSETQRTPEPFWTSKRRNLQSKFRSGILIESSCLTLGCLTFSESFRYFHFRRCTLQITSIRPTAVPTWLICHLKALWTRNQFLRLGVVALMPFIPIHWTKIRMLQTKTQNSFHNL